MLHYAYAHIRTRKITLAPPPPVLYGCATKFCIFQSTTTERALRHWYDDDDDDDDDDDAFDLDS